MNVSLISRFSAVVCTMALLTSCKGGSLQPSFEPSAGAQSNTVAQNAGTGPRATHYHLVFLDTPHGTSSFANGINDRGWITGISNDPGQNGHATLWTSGHRTDLGTLGGPKSAVSWPVKGTSGEIAGNSTTSQRDPLSEHFCGGPRICLGFAWKNGVMTPLPTLGGNNGQATGINNHNWFAGLAETNVRDTSCAAPQQLDYSAVVWQPNGKVLALPPIYGDAVSQAIAINNSGQVAGASGPCGPALNPGYGAAHAVLWQTGAAIDLGNLGGTAFNAAAAMNDGGQIVGISGLPGNTTYHAFLWQNGSMSDLGTLPGDAQSVAFGINNKGQVAGQSCNANGKRCRAFLWQKGAMTDLNLLVPSHPSFDLIYGGDVNDSGWIVGNARDKNTGLVRAFLMIPSGS